MSRRNSVMLSSRRERQRRCERCGRPSYGAAMTAPGKFTCRTCITRDIRVMPKGSDE